jgi:hypothetical protein
MKTCFLRSFWIEQACLDKAMAKILVSSNINHYQRQLTKLVVVVYIPKSLKIVILPYKMLKKFANIASSLGAFVEVLCLALKTKRRCSRCTFIEVCLLNINIYVMENTS